MTATVEETIPDELLDFEPPCEAEPCEDPAAWSIRFEETCEHGNVALICAPHKAQLLFWDRLAAGKWNCRICAKTTAIVEIKALR